MNVFALDVVEAEVIVRVRVAAVRSRLELLKGRGAVRRPKLDAALVMLRGRRGGGTGGRRSRGRLRRGRRSRRGRRLRVWLRERRGLALARRLLRGLLAGA